jgi:hypothetical protein
MVQHMVIILFSQKNKEILNTAQYSTHAQDIAIFFFLHSFIESISIAQTI